MSIAIVIFPLQDTMLRSTFLGFFGAAPSGFFILAALPFLINQRKFDRSMRSAPVYLFAFLLVGALTGLIWMSLQLDSTDLVTRYAYKAYSIGLLFLSFLIPAFYPPTPSKIIYTSLLISLSIGIVGVFMCDIIRTPLEYPSPLHFSPTVTAPRGFSLETSTLGATLPVTAFCAAALARHWQIRFLLFAFGLALAIFISSKGGLVATALAAVTVILANRRFDARIKFIMIFVGAILAWTFSLAVLNRFEQESVQYTSISTRVLYGLLAIQSLVSNPFGVGFSGFTPFFLRSAEPLSSLASLLHLSGAQLSEVARYYSDQTGYNASTKTLFGDICVIWGIPGALISAMTIIKLGRVAWRNSDDGILFAIYTYSLMSLLFYVPGLTLYALPLSIGLTQIRHRNKYERG